MIPFRDHGAQTPSRRYLLQRAMTDSNKESCKCGWHPPAIFFALTLQVVLLVILVPKGGAPGAAVSFLAGITGLHLYMAFDGWVSHAKQPINKRMGR